MNSSPSELISTLRKKISFQSLILLLLIAAIMIVSFVVRKNTSPFFEGVILVSFLIFVFLAYLILKRKAAWLKRLDAAQPEKTISEIEIYITAEQKNFRSLDIARLILGVALTLTMLAFIFFKSQSRLAGEICAIWFGLILLSMFQSWILMKDGILLQDLKHCLRDHPSETS